MKKIKITKEQYKAIQENAKLTIQKGLTETKELKITIGQYKRLLSTGVINESKNNVKLIIESVDTSTIKKETLELIKHFYRKSPELSPFWGENNLSYDDICDSLLSKNIIIKQGDIIKLSKSLGEDPHSAKKALEDALTELLNGETEDVAEPEVEAELETESDGDYPAGAANDPNADYNKPDGEMTNPETSVESNLNVLGNNDEIAILEGPDQEMYAFYFGDKTEVFKPYASLSRKYTGNDEEGNKEYEYGDDFDIDSDVISSYVNDNLGLLTKGEGYEAWEAGKDIVKIDDELREELFRFYDKDKTIGPILSPKDLESEGITIGGQPQTGTVSTDWSETKNVAPKLRTNDENGKIVAKLIALKKREQESNPPTVSKTPLPETTGTASAGAFVAPIGLDSDTSVIKREIPTIGETTTVASVGGQYDTPGLANIGRNGEFKKGPKTKAQSKTQYAGGGFVETSSCNKLNNNKEAQNGGCSQGAVDGVVSLKKSKGSIISPSLGENTIIEMIAKKTGKTIEEVTEIIKTKK